MDRRRFLAAGLGLAAAPLMLRFDPATASARRSIPAPTASLVTRWDTDPWSRGSYSALPVGTSPSVRRTLADAIIGGRIALAGEYASTDFPATTTGAYLSGRHAARRLLGRANARTAIVIGAGMAGASAASDLRAAGVDVTVLEARDRVGGRIHSDEAWGAPVELGAAWIHALRGNPLVPLAQESGLALVPTNYDDAIARDTVTGRRSTAAESRASTLEGLIGRLERAWPPVDTSVGAWLASQGWSASRLDRWAEAVEITEEYGLDPRRLGVRATEEGADYRGGDAMVAGGYVTIVDDLLAGSDVRLSTAVESVSTRGSRAEVTLQSGARVIADIAVVAVPLALVRAGRPKLPDMTGSVRAALRRITTGNLEKVVLRYDEHWWGDYQVYGIVGGGAQGAPAGTPASLRWTEFYSLTDVLGFPALVGFSGGSAARSRPPSDAGCVSEASSALAAAFAR
ncbi:MAG: hypothetical protein RLZ94_2529 [Actinomycetota bacterium]